MKRALVTGGGSGAGAVIARALADSGVAVTVCGRRPIDAPGLTSAICDVTDEAQVAALFADHGPFHIVVANAGASESAPFKRTEKAALDRMLAVNVTGTFLTFREAARTMTDGGRMIAVASTAGLKGYAYVAPYAAAKHAVVGLVRSVALELAGEGITVNAVCPGFMETEMTAASVARIMEKTGRSEDEARAALAGTNPMGKLVDPDDVAQAVLWLCGPGSGMVTGQTIAISGGET
ncbi:SDR family NAD(P)-dependent oxidoreductase [Falsirhodobacter sp. 1013]|uniref:SDR family NAD(P)-dependent oxidoreductase n=1 Tax=Falsirhodobacter sp. 1013 TaxID=3417566 RepID=UPI003EC06376